VGYEHGPVGMGAPAHDCPRQLRDVPASWTDTAPHIPIAYARRDKVAVSFWRISADTIGDDYTASHSDAGDNPLTPRLARHLITIYNNPHDTVIDSTPTSICTMPPR
jgi:hypothetical protein